MAVTTVVPPIPALQTATPKTGAHFHYCYRNNHKFTCQYSVSCGLEMLAGGQARIDEMCPGCHNLAYGQYAS